ncbi:MAG: hypothetical protein ABI862_15810 [Ilumatobacteraceae bacterium]
MALLVDDWDTTLLQLRIDGFSSIETIKITRAVQRVSLAEAKRIVHESVAWADVRPDFEYLHNVVDEVGSRL